VGNLLKRLEQKGNQQSGGAGGNNSNTPAPSGGAGGRPGGGESKLDQMRRPMPQAGQVGMQKEGYADLKSRVQQKLLSELDPSMDTRSAEVRSTIEELFSTILAEENIVLSRNEKQRLFEQIVAEILGLGPLETLLADETVSEIMVNGPKNVYIEQKGRLTRTNVTFENDDHVLRVLDRIVAPLGRRIDESSPMVDARLADGSRVNAIIRPLALCGPTITIRKFSKKPYRAVRVRARPPCSTCSLALFPMMSVSSQSKTRLNYSFVRNTS
jgi:pilus assembly protein CpaF